MCNKHLFYLKLILTYKSQIKFILISSHLVAVALPNFFLEVFFDNPIVRANCKKYREFCRIYRKLGIFLWSCDQYFASFKSITINMTVNKNIKNLMFESKK